MSRRGPVHAGRSSSGPDAAATAARGDRLALGAEAREHRVHAVRVEPEQPDGRGRRPAHRTRARSPAPRPAGSTPAAAATAPNAIAWCGPPARCAAASASSRASGQTARPARSSARPCVREIRRWTAAGCRASASASRSSEVAAAAGRRGQRRLHESLGVQPSAQERLERREVVHRPVRDGDLQPAGVRVPARREPPVGQQQQRGRDHARILPPQRLHPPVHLQLPSPTRHFTRWAQRGRWRVGE